ncbi:hypothetical protein [Polaribacter septentrionalilitoris]|uniref:hypothetical protein n=1 Tax=Polaribacter septentrionalilitoris TaxID=2494657 RepID=UPI00135C0405|nr:hypothetical protein [Polaribacter septentrionalilitoris]
MKKFLFLFAVFISYQSIYSQSEKIPKKNIQKGFAKIDYLSIDMPITNIPNETNMGFTGIHYNLNLKNNFYTGIGIYGSVSGSRGGFFTLGVNAGLKKYFSDGFYLDTGFHFGGGGGAGAPDGGGAFILPHFNLGYDFKYFSVNSGWSYVDFFDDGLIKGHQLNVSLEISLDFEHSNYNASEKEFEIESLSSSDWNQKSKRSSLMLHANNLKVVKDNTGVIKKGKTINLVGFEYASYFNENWFAFLKVDGAYNGIRAGYMDVFFGAGYLLPIIKNNTNVLAKFGIGAGGGGGVDSGGGFMIYPDLSIEQKLFNDIYISINKGYLLTPDKKFNTSTFGIGLKYYLERNGIINDDESYSKTKFKGFEFIVKQDIYFNAKRETEPTEDMHQISLQINVDLNKSLFIAGQTSFANFGNAGAYAEGLVGLGFKTKPTLNTSISFFTQFLAGAAGGGNISTGQGLIIKPSAGLDYKLTNTLNLRAAGGYVKAKGGTLSSPFLNFGIKYNISLLKLK